MRAAGFYLCAPPFCLQEQETPLHCAAWHGYSPVARALCQAGCHVDAKNREGESPLLTASARGFVDIVECLVEHGAELETTDKVIRAQPGLFWHISFYRAETFSTSCGVTCFYNTKKVCLYVFNLSPGF